MHVSPGINVVRPHEQKRLGQRIQPLPTTALLRELRSLSEDCKTGIRLCQAQMAARLRARAPFNQPQNRAGYLRVD